MAHASRVTGMRTGRPGEASFERTTLFTGVEGVFLSADLAAALNSPGGGLLLQTVARGSPADAIGLRGGRINADLGGETLLLGGDIVLAFARVTIDGTPESLQRARAALAALEPGTAVDITVLRDGHRHELTFSVR